MSLRLGAISAHKRPAPDVTGHYRCVEVTALHTNVPPRIKEQTSSIVRNHPIVIVGIWFGGAPAMSAGGVVDGIRKATNKYLKFIECRDAFSRPFHSEVKPLCLECQERIFHPTQLVGGWRVRQTSGQPRHSSLRDIRFLLAPFWVLIELCTCSTDQVVCVMVAPVIRYPQGETFRIATRSYSCPIPWTVLYVY